MADRALLALTGFFKGDNYDGLSPNGVWTSAASAGVSAGRTLSQVSSPPLGGTLLNGHNSAAFDGVGANAYRLDSSNGTGESISQYLHSGGSVGTFWVVATPRALAADPGAGSRYAAPTIVDGVLGYHLLTFYTGGVTWALTGTTPGFVQVDVPANLVVGTPFLIEGKLDGANVYLRVNRGDWVSTPSDGIAVAGLSDSLRLGSPTSAIDIYEAAFSDLALTDAVLDSVGEDIEIYYDRNFGFTVYAWQPPPPLLVAGPIIAGPFGYFPPTPTFESEAILVEAFATLDATLEDATLASTATAPAAATLAVTLADITLVSAASSPAAATLAKTLGDVTVVSAASAPAAATLAKTLGDVTLASAATSPAAATLSATLDGATLSSAASAPAACTLATTLDGITLSSTASAPAQATLAVTLGDVTSTSSVSSPVAATFARTLGDATASSTVSAPAVASLAVTLGDATLVSLVTAQAPAVLSATLEGVTLASTASAPAAATLAATLGDVTLESLAYQYTEAVASLAVTLEGVSLESSVRHLGPADFVFVDTVLVSTPSDEVPEVPTDGDVDVDILIVATEDAPPSFDWESAQERVIVEVN